MFIIAAVKRNPIARNATQHTYQQVTSKWLWGARDRDGGHLTRTRGRQLATGQEPNHSRALGRERARDSAEGH